MTWTRPFSSSSASSPKKSRTRRGPEVARWLTPEQVRVWRLYLVGGALAFEQGRMGVDQILATRPRR